MEIDKEMLVTVRDAVFSHMSRLNAHLNGIQMDEILATTLEAKAWHGKNAMEVKRQITLLARWLTENPQQ